jgi:uncharacterized protein (TIGR00290 family)
MDSKEQIIFSWSGGKDSAQALFKLQNEDQYAIAALLTTVTEGYDRVSMHGVRLELLTRQASALDVPLDIVRIPKDCDNEKYERRMGDRLNFWKREGIAKVAFGDIFLEDLRAYRETNLRKANMDAIFPIWKIDSKKLAQDFIEQGFKSVLVCVDTKTLNAKYAGRTYDERLLQEFPAGIDPCGENGEFHTFVYNGPNFKEGLPITVGETMVRDGFAFTDIF